jgi:RNA-directed DNA polymerase
MVGGKKNKGGTPQGGVASPLLANIYMNRCLKHWRRSGCGEAFRAHVVSYADDFVILSRGRAAEALTWTKGVMTKLGLVLNEAKTLPVGSASHSLATRLARTTPTTRVRVCICT